MKNDVYYIGFNTKYGNPNSFIEFPSVNSKMAYIIDSLLSNNYNVLVFSLGFSESFNKSVFTSEFDNLSVKYVGTIPNIGFLKIFSKIYLIIQLWVYFLFRVKKGSTIIVYHSLFLPYIVKFILFFKKFDIVYEVEEIYKAAWQSNEKEIYREIRSIAFAKKYIYVNDMMAGSFKFNMPNIVCYGDYTSKKLKKLNNNVDEIVIVYAGIIGDVNSDVYLIINAMRFLPLKYKLKIVGYGSEMDLCLMKKTIKDFGNIVYDGILTGERYSDYLLKCDIGIAPRRLDNALSNYTFPSKVLVYLGHNLFTITSRIDCISKSKISNSIIFIDDLTPIGVASTIQNVDINVVYSNSILEILDREFKRDLKKLIES